MGSSAQISSGVCRCGSQEQVPEEGSGSFWRVPACIGAGSGGRFRNVLENSGGRFRKVPEGLGRGERFRKVPERAGVGFQRQVPEGSGGFRKVAASSGEFWRAGVGCGGRFRRVSERAGWCRFRRQGSEGSKSSGAATVTGAAM